MRDANAKTPVAIGFRSKTGRAIAVVLAGPVASPQVIERREIQLWDPKTPDSFQPWHAVLGKPGQEVRLIVRRLTTTVRELSIQAVRDLVRELRERGFEPKAVGIVVSSLTDPATVKNPHMHAHAQEGRLFREVLQAAAETCSLPNMVLIEKEAYDHAAEALRTRSSALERAVKEFGRSVGRPWRSDEKMAALGAWVALAAPARAG